MLDRLEERRAIRDRIKAAYDRERSVADDPGIVALDAAVDAAVAARDRAVEHYIGETHASVLESVIESNGDLLVHDGELVFCALSDMPIFVGDRVVPVALAFDDKVFILAEFVNVEAAGAKVVVAAHDEGTSDEDDPE